MDTQTKAKKLLIDHLQTYSKSKCVNENKIDIINAENCDAVIYNLRTIIKTNKSSEELFNIDVQPSHNSYIADSYTKTYPCEYHTYNLESVRLKCCYKCNGKKFIENENCGFKKVPVNYISNSVNAETGEVIHDNQYNSRQSVENVLCSAVCNVCNGHGKLNQFNRRTLIEDCIYDVRVKCNIKALPLKSILKNKGNLIVNQTNKKLTAISTFPDDEIFDISNDLLKRHEARLKNSPNWELVNQTHQLIVIPIVSYTAKYKEKTINFYLFTDTNDIFVNKQNNSCSLL